MSPWPKSQEIRAPTHQAQQPVNKMTGRASRQTSNPYAQPVSQPAYPATNSYQTPSAAAPTANPYQNNTGYGAATQPKVTQQQPYYPGSTGQVSTP